MDEDTFLHLFLIPLCRKSDIFGEMRRWQPLDHDNWGRRQSQGLHLFSFWYSLLGLPLSRFCVSVQSGCPLGLPSPPGERWRPALVSEQPKAPLQGVSGFCPARNRVDLILSSSSSCAVLFSMNLMEEDMYLIDICKPPTNALTIHCV